MDVPLPRWMIARWLRRDEHRSVRALSQARSARIRAVARAILENLWAQGGEPRSQVWTAIWLDARQRPDIGGVVDLPYPIVEFLMDPAPETDHRPAVRVVAAAADDVRDRLISLDTLVHAVTGSADVRSREALIDLLVTTDQPRLLDAIEDVFIAGVNGRPDVALWDDHGEPGPPLRLALGNPHLDRPPRRHHGLFNWPINELGILAVMRGRSDMLHLFEPYFLVRMLCVHAWTARSSPVAEICRAILRELPHGRLREMLCQEAMEDSAGAREAVIDAGYLPADPRRIALFLYTTGQWQRLRTHDPRGRQLRRHRHLYTDRDWAHLTNASREQDAPAPPERIWPQPLPPPPPPKRGPPGIGGAGRYVDPGSGYTGGFSC